jgi:cell division protein FtsX
MKIINIFLLAFKKIMSEKAWSLTHIILVILVLILLSTVFPLTQFIHVTASRYINQTTTVIEVRPHAQVYYSWNLESPLDVHYNEFFNNSDVERIMNITYVTDVIRGVELHVRVFPGFSKCIPGYPGENLTELYIKIVQDEYPDLTREEIISRLERISKLSGLSFDEVVKNQLEGWLSSGFELLGIEAEKLGGVSSYFNDIIDGRFINPGTNETVISIDKVRFGYVMGDRVLSCNESVNLGDSLDILYERYYPPDSPYKCYKVKVVGFKSPHIFDDMVVDYEFAINLIKTELNVNRHEDMLKKLPLYTVLFVKVDSPEHVNEVAKKIMEIYPMAGVYFSGRASNEAYKLLSSIEASYTLTFYSTASVTVAIIFIARVFEIFKRRREYGLLRSVGWYKSSVSILNLVTGLMLGLLAGVFASAILIALKPYIVNLLEVDIIRHGLIEHEVGSVLNYLTRNVPPDYMLILNPLIGLIISGIASLISIFVYLRIPLEETLKEV